MILTELALLKNEQKNYSQADDFFAKAIASWQSMIESPQGLSELTGSTDLAMLKEFVYTASSAHHHWASSLRFRGRTQEANVLTEKATQLSRLAGSWADPADASN
jgi:hypothetical protein